MPLNFSTVEDVHTFAVGDGDWVVHNCTFSDEVENFVTQHGNSNLTREQIRENAQVIRELMGGIEPNAPASVREMPIVFPNELTQRQIDALLWNQAGHIDNTIRTSIETQNFDGLLNQVSLARYRFLADPRVRDALNIEFQALQHPGIPDDVRRRIYDNLFQVLSLYGFDY
ncbi:MAG: hypothetical protein WBC91_10305 [Phototrophicaceae bacterium]